MIVEIADIAIQAVIHSQQAYCKFLSANDSGATGGHQCGILVSKSVKPMIFEQDLFEETILKRTIEIRWQNDFITESCFTYYKSKNEFRLTKFGRCFPFLNPDQTGALFVLTKHDTDQYQGFFLENEDSIERFLNAFGMSPTETNGLIPQRDILPEIHEQIAFQSFISTLDTEFPASDIMSKAARDIQNSVYNHFEYIKTNPDRKLIEWTNIEYSLFRAIEHERYGKLIAQGFSNVDDFISMANMVLNRRKSRAGKSLEHHLCAIFDTNQIHYSAQATTEGNKRPDFLFPSQSAYLDNTFPAHKLVSLAAKTTCKDRWRQVLNEADRLKEYPKYLCTLQQGISPAQMDEMQAEQVILIVPRPYISYYPKDRQSRIWTLSQFVSFVRGLE